MRNRAFAEYWKAFDGNRETFVPRITAEVKQLFRKERKTVIDSLYAGFPAADGIDVRRWSDMLLRIAGLAIPGFAEMVYRQIFGLKSVVTFDTSGFDELAKEFVRLYGADKVKQITETTKDKIKTVLDQALIDGVGVDEIAERLDDLYLDQIIPNRSEVIARTEILHASNWGAHQGALLTNVGVVKIWIATPGNRTRPAHAAANGQTVGLDEPFIVAGEKMAFPGDPSMGASAANTIQCRCAAGYERAPEKPKPAARPKKPRPPKPEELPPGVVGVPVFPTAKKAEKWAQDNLGIAHVDYTNICTEAANEINKTIHAFQQRFPQVRDTKWVSSTQKMFAAEHEERIKERAQKLINVGHDPDQAYIWAKKNTPKRKANPKAYAVSTNRAWGALEGISVSEKYFKTAKSYETYKKMLANDAMLGFHPPGSDFPGSVVTHEMAHQLHNLLIYRGAHGFVDALFDSFKRDIASGIGANKLVSRYATVNSHEFFAEAVTEYLHNPTPRRYAKEIGEAAETALKTM